MDVCVSFWHKWEAERRTSICLEHQAPRGAKEGHKNPPGLSWNTLTGLILRREKDKTLGVVKEGGNKRRKKEEIRNNVGEIRAEWFIRLGDERHLGKAGGL